MTLLSVERIKLFSTRSPYWCLVSILAAALLLALLIGLVESGREATTFLSQSGLQLGMIVFMVLAALAITTEYRFSTIKVSFLAVPKRANVLIAKTVLLMMLAVVTALICSFAAFFLTKVLANPKIPMTLSTGDDWRMVLGNAALFPIAAVIAIAVGTLIRQSAGAITFLLVWPLLIENLVQLIPRWGQDIHNWMPFSAASNFISPGPNAQVFGQALGVGGPTPLEGLAVFAATAVVLWVAALVVLMRRDA